jgi:hypothetical protein
VTRKRLTKRTGKRKVLIPIDELVDRISATTAGSRGFVRSTPNISAPV